MVLLTIFFIFIVVISIDPTGSILHLKEPLFILLLLSSFPKLKNRKVPKSILLVLLICLLIPIYGIMIAILKENFSDTEYAWGHLKSFIFIFIVLFLINLKFEDILKCLFFCGSLIAVLTLVIFIIAQLNHDLFTAIHNQSIENSNIIISKRIYYGISILGVYFKAGPLMLFSYVYSLYYFNSKWRFFFISLNLFALLMAGSRTPMLMAVFLSLIYLYDNFKLGRSLRILFFFFCIVGMVSITYKLATEKGESSNDVKFNDLNSYVQVIFSGTTPLIGDGLGSEFFSAGRNLMVSNTEQTFMDILRIYGFIIGGCLILAVLYPFIYFLSCRYRHVLKYQRFILAYVLYIILSGTNPLLICSTGMLVWALGLTFVYQIKMNLLE